MASLSDSTASFLLRLQKSTSEFQVISDKLEQEFSDRYPDVSKELGFTDVLRQASTRFEFLASFLSLRTRRSEAHQSPAPLRSLHPTITRRETRSTSYPGSGA